MSKLDQFESAFKSASKARYRYSTLEFERILVVTDLDEEAGRRFADDVKAFLSVLDIRHETHWTHHCARPEEDVVALLEAVETERPDLICTYRNLHGRARTYPFSLGSHVDVLCQATSTPVMLLPFPNGSDRLDEKCEMTSNIMVLTDHLTGSDRLIDHGVRFTSSGGKLVLAHLEDDATFERYMDIISKIPAIETEVARKRIGDQLLKEPADFIATVVETLSDQVADVTVFKEVRMGHQVDDCKSLVGEHDIRLVVMNTKDDEQLAMHGLAYPLAVELREIPLLLL